MSRLTNWLRRSTARKASTAPPAQYLSTVHLAPPFDAPLDPLPESMLAPSMMSENECRFLHQIARDYYRGDGCIVDAGIFLGASTLCFGLGLQANPSGALERAPAQPVVSLELGIVTPTMPRYFAQHGIADDVMPGMSFEDLTRTFLTPVADLVDLRFGDIRQEGKVDGPIEILFLDVLKNVTLSVFALEQYFPKLIAGRSLVIQQDYFFDGLEFIKLHQEFFASHFDYVGEIGSSAAFRCVKTITADDLARFHAARDDANVQIDLADIAMSRTRDPARRLFMAVSKLRVIMAMRGAEAAQAYLAEIRRDFAALFADPFCPPRVHTALAGAAYLVNSTGDRKAFTQAQMIALGHIAADAPA